MMNETHKLFYLMGFDFNVITSQMLEPMIEHVNEQIPNISDSFWDKFRNDLDAESLRKMYADIYEQHFTHKEISDLIEFHESVLGKKTVKANQQIALESQAISSAYFEALGNEVMKELLAENNA
ncbi:MAG: DUF2059 domain-containing protein [Chitinispirillales bacterium]|jgi:hypothetical protein|nr:DUF2059 domain-containing protein [Chitinispirillales bacterium]